MPEETRPRRGIADDAPPEPSSPADGGSAADVHPVRRGAREHLMDFLRPNRGQLVLAVVLALTAMLVVLTLRSQAAQPDYSNLRRAELIQLLDNLSAETRRLETEVRELQGTRDDLASGAEGAQAAEDEAQRRLDQLQIISGTVPVHGQGIRLRIDDPANKVSPELLLDGLEELRDAGAEVVEFNDSVRVVASTWLGLDGQGRIVADGTVLEDPVVIDAIGDPATLEAGARFRGGLVSEIEGPRVEGIVTIEQLDDVEIDSVVVPKENEFALPN
ncbi:DUF881 domain-containing protein [Tessaracoccus sp. OS52]|uniref:DUF881 domain-containing protein n=1 Tax=Tessaracoccus sp. OS52 TaxID=2886691 RepID=UPI001D126BE3|nr:DUF881 domain-containing protein [Tessaracoccus sp. OS52]MCC2592862.1 DUF881 domain-containing protein [Tessaracoccus sp. OS52]